MLASLPGSRARDTRSPADEAGADRHVRRASIGLPSAPRPDGHRRSASARGATTTLARVGRCAPPQALGCARQVDPLHSAPLTCGESSERGAHRLRSGRRGRRRARRRSGPGDGGSRGGHSGGERHDRRRDQLAQLRCHTRRHLLPAGQPQSAAVRAGQARALSVLRRPWRRACAGRQTPCRDRGGSARVARRLSSSRRRQRCWRPRAARPEAGRRARARGALRGRAAFAVYRHHRCARLHAGAARRRRIQWGHGRPAQPLAARAGQRQGTRSSRSAAHSPCSSAALG